jgi:hypothetical protein
MNISTVGIDLTKNVFQIHGANERGKKLWNKQLQRKQVLKFSRFILVYARQYRQCGLNVSASF